MTDFNAESYPELMYLANMEKWKVKVKEKEGESITGSKYIRAFCFGCGEPIRVTGNIKDKRKYCNCCLPQINVFLKFDKTLTYRQQIKKENDEVNP